MQKINRFFARDGKLEIGNYQKMCEEFENRSDYSQVPEAREISKPNFFPESIRFKKWISAEI